MGFKVLTYRELELFNFSYKNAKLSPINKDSRLEHIFEQLEQNLEYLGCVSIQDKISEKTKETITSLNQAGIKFWLMSGENEDLTLSTAIASNIINFDSNVVRLTNYVTQLEFAVDLIDVLKKEILNHTENAFGVDSDNNLIEPRKSGSRRATNIMEFNNPVEHFSEDQNQMLSEAPVIRRKNRRTTLKAIHPIVTQLGSVNISSPLNQKFNHYLVDYVLIIDRTAIQHAFATEQNKKIFCILLSSATAVVFYSLKPSDKTNIAKLLKNNFSYKPTFLSIGDSISDVGMIKKANIGVGINGNKGA